MSNQLITGLPGMGSSRTATYRRVFKSGPDEFLAGGGVIDGTTCRDPGNTDLTDRLRAGLVMGLRTADNQWSNSILGVTTNAEAAGSTSIEAGAAVVTELVRRVGSSGTFKLIGPAVAGGTIQVETVTYSAASGTTITATAITLPFIAGSFICPTDGSEIPRTLMPDDYPMKVTDVNGTSQDQPWPNIPIGGVVDSSQIVNWPSDTALRAWLTENLKQYGRFVMDHDYGN